MLDAHDGNLLEEHAELGARLDMVNLSAPFRYKDRRRGFYASLCLLDRALERVELTPKLYDEWWAFFNNPSPSSRPDDVLDALCAFEKNVDVFLDARRWAELLALKRGLPGYVREFHEHFSLDVFSDTCNMRLYERVRVYVAQGRAKDAMTLLHEASRIMGEQLDDELFAAKRGCAHILTFSSLLEQVEAVVKAEARQSFRANSSV